MKKKLIFCICIVLSLIICISAIPFSAYTYDCEVEVTSAAVLVANLNTGTFVYEHNIDKARYTSYLCNVMTFIVARNNVPDTSERITVKKEVLDSVKNSDGSLDKYVDHTLTVKDLLYFIMLNNSPDAAYVLADYVSDGNIDYFVELMNKKATSLGCTKTKFSSPGVVFDKSQYTTCEDMYKIIKCALDTPDYIEISGTSSYMPEGYKKKELNLSTTNSLINENSPYYFKHIKTGKFGYDNVAKGNVSVTSTYSDVSYVCIVMGASNSSEHNAFTETKQLLTWAYTKLGNKQIVDKDDVLGNITVNSVWGDAVIELTAGTDIIRTMPSDYESAKITYEYNTKSSVKPPVFKGQNMGTATIYYDGKVFEEINLISSSSNGVSMVGDLSGFVSAMHNATFTAKSDDTTTSKKQEPTETATQAQTNNNSDETSTQAVQ